MAQITLELDVETKEGLKALGDITRKAKTSAVKMADSAKIASNAWSTFKGVLGANIVSGVFAQMQHAAGMFFDSVVDNTILMETLTTEMTTMTGSAEKAAEVMADLSNFAATTPFQLEGIASAAKQLIAFGFEVDSITDKMKIIGDVAAGSGSQLSDVALVYGQVAAAGKLTGERLLQFQERAIPIGPAIAKTMGIAEESVKDMVSKGKVDLATFEKAFATLTEEGGLFYNSMIDKSETTAGVISTLKDNFAVFAAELGKKFLPMFKTIAKAMTKFISDNKELLVSNIGGAITESLKKLLKIMPDVIRGLKLAFVTTVSVATFTMNGFKGSIDTVGLAIATLARATLATVFGYQKLKNIVSDNDAELQESKLAWQEMVQVQKDFKNELANTGNDTKKTFDELWAAFNNEEESSILDETLSNLIKQLDEVGKKSEEIETDKKIKISAEGDGGGLFDFAAIKAKFTEMFMSVGKSVEGFFSEGFGKGIATFGKNFANILKSGMKTQRANMDKLASLDEQIRIAILHGDEQKADELRQQRAEAEKQMTADQTAAAVQTFQAGITAVGAAFGPWGEAIAGFINMFIEFAQDPEALVALVEGIVDAIPDIIDALIEAMPVIAEALAENAVPITLAIAEGVHKMFLNMPSIMASAAQGFINGLKESLSEITNPLKDISITLEGISGFFEGLLVDFPQALIDGATHFINQLVEEIKGAISFDIATTVGGGGSGKGPLTGIPGSPLATGGVIPGGFPNDTFPARLTSGEEVVSVGDRKSILDDQKMIKGMLAQLMQGQGQPVVVQSELRLNDQVLADIILELDRDNKRIAL